MIYITGDTHGDFARLSKKHLKGKGIELSSEDYMVICGDMGLCWAKDGTFQYHCRNFQQKEYTLLWIQGNHENYDMIAEYPIEEWHGGKVRHIVRDKVILLERGQVFDLNGYSFFTFGGASSHDIQGGILDRNDLDFAYDRRRAIDNELPFRIMHESWWSQELPDVKEMEEGTVNLIRCGYKVDYVLTHCCATRLQEILNIERLRSCKPDRLTDYLQELESKLQYKHWFFGHYHMDKCIDEKHTVLYHEIIALNN